MRADPGEHEGLIHHAEPPVQVDRVQLAQPAVLDLGHDRRGRVQRGQPALRGFHVMLAKHAADGELEQRHPLRDQFPDGRVAAGEPQVTRIKAVRLHGDESLGDELLFHPERPQGGTLPRGVAVERENDLTAELALVHQQAPQDADVTIAEGRAGGGDGGGDAGQVAGHHVGVTLDDDGLAALRDFPLRQVRPVEHRALLEENRLWRVQVLGALVTGRELAGAERDDVAAQVPDRPDQAVMEPVDRPVPALLGQPAEDQLGLGEPAPAQVPGERVPFGRRVADAELRRIRQLESALGKESARSQRIGA